MLFAALPSSAQAVIRLLSSSLVLSLCATTHAELVLQPEALQAGDEYRLIFLTSTTRDALSTDIDDYNVFVQATADAAPVVGSWQLEWKALTSTDQTDARDNTNTNWEIETGVPIYRVDGALFSRNNRELWPEREDIISLADLNMTELETSITDFDRLGRIPVWTGSSMLGVAEPRLTLGSPNSVAIGDARVLSSSFLVSQGGRSTGEPAHLYALSETLTAVPEPSSLVPVTLVLFSLGVFRRRRILPG